VLARAGVRTLTTDDGPTCLDMARRTRPKLVVAASYLPGLTGPELAEALRRLPLLARARIVLLAAAGTSAPPPGSVDADVVLASADASGELSKLVPELLASEAKDHPLDEEQAKWLERQARVAAHELSLYHPLATDREALEAEAAETRDWLASQWPGCPKRARELFDAALREQAPGGAETG
jgi:CheY-like chemotaxis protein